MEASKWIEGGRKLVVVHRRDRNGEMEFTVVVCSWPELKVSIVDVIEVYIESGLHTNKRM